MYVYDRSSYYCLRLVYYICLCHMAVFFGFKIMANATNANPDP